jgi:Outer membrane protein beta-barrel domain
MKKVLFAIFGTVVITATGLAQKGNNQITPAAEVAILTGDASDASSIGLGVTVKALYGVGEAGQLTFTTGYLSASAKKEFKELLDADKIRSTMIPLLAGYRHHFNGFYAEPQVGYGIYGAKIKGGEYASSDSQGAFTWAAGIGYIYNNVEVGARYQSMHKDGESSGFIGFRIGYNFSVNPK